MVAATSAFVLNAGTGTLPEHQSLEPSSSRPRCSSILHLFGPWLFEAAFIGSEFAKQFAASDSGSGPASTPQGARQFDSLPLGLRQFCPPHLINDIVRRLLQPCHVRHQLRS